VKYEDTEHYQLTRRVLNDPDGVLKAVFSDDAERPQDS